MNCIRRECRSERYGGVLEIVAHRRRIPMAALPTEVREATVLEEARAIVKADEARDSVRASARLMLRIASQKLGNRADGQPTESEDTWLLLLSAVSRDEI